VNNLAQRTITGLIGAAVLIGGIIYSEQTFLILLIFISTMSLLEFYRVSENETTKPQRTMGIIINILIFIPPLIQNIFQTGFNLLPLIIILPYIIFIRELYLKKEKPLINISVTLLGIIYISLPLFCLYLISFHGITGGYQYECIFGYFFIMWANDIGAYFAGTWFGKHKLFERISPKKTWEGFFGGLIFSLLIAYGIAHFFINFSFMQWMIIAAIILVTGTLGDLVESMFKRSIGIKDSGSVLPGHGGFLDRFDGLFISAPFVFFFLQMW
jgi:phosphatidate cytidylyltransferase